MTEWYYARYGRQSGPVTFEELAEFARAGGIGPEDLVWTASMRDWTPAGRVAGLCAAPATPAITAHPADPYATPASTWIETPPSAPLALMEIIPGSEPLMVGACVNRGFELTMRHFGTILLMGLIYLGVFTVAGVILGGIDSVLGLPPAPQLEFHAGYFHFHFGFNLMDGPTHEHASYLNVLLSAVLGVFFALGATRIGLNMVSGREFTLGMLLGGGRQLPVALGVSLIYQLMVDVGLALLIVPGIYLALRFGQFFKAMVDRDLGIIQSLQYSSVLTTRNLMNLFLLALMSILIIFAGVLICFIGLIFAIPIVWLSWLVAFRWLQFGHRAALDHRGTIIPLLAAK